MALESGVNGETASRRIHAGHVLHIVDLLEGHLLAVVPVLVVQVLLDEGVGLHSAIRVHHGHVHVIYEVDELLAPRRAKITASFLLKGLLHHTCARMCDGGCKILFMQTYAGSGVAHLEASWRWCSG